MSDFRKSALLRAAASLGALTVFGFSTWIVVGSLTFSGSLTAFQHSSAWVAGTLVAALVVSAIWLPWLSAYRSARR